MNSYFINVCIRSLKEVTTQSLLIKQYRIMISYIGQKLCTKQFEGELGKGSWLLPARSPMFLICTSLALLLNFIKWLRMGFVNR
jgi:hypothetical protein